ncbi:MAG: hypothetical protein PQJ58_00400 [Spirochaetales bacterium]|nr:hypothetical protein [Spirochaetales bacterium]
MNSFKMHIEGFYRVIPMKEFRRTPGVEFHILAKDMIPRVDGVDRVIHKTDAVSPGPVGTIDRPWYMHTHQDDNLIVLSGKRTVDIYHPRIGDVLTFEVTPDCICTDGITVYDDPAVLVWPRGVFHRIVSGSDGSASLNLATRYEGYDISTNFSIYDLNTETGDYQVIRKGALDQH